MSAHVLGLMDGDFFKRDLGFKGASDDPNAGTLMHADKVIIRLTP
jgi:hypothetical protein